MSRDSSSGIHVLEHGGVLVLHNEGLLAHGDGRYFPAEQICRLLRREIDDAIMPASEAP